jgi:hypothetical protein
VRFGLTVKKMAEALLLYPMIADVLRWADAQLRVLFPPPNKGRSNQTISMDVR